MPRNRGPNKIRHKRIPRWPAQAGKMVLNGKPQTPHPKKWDEIKQQIQLGLIHCYPQTQETREHSNKNTLTNIQEHQAWGTNEEQKEGQEAANKRAAIRKDYNA